METRAKLRIQDEIKAGKYELVSSYMLEYENSQNRDPMKRYMGNEINILNPLEFTRLVEEEDL